MNSLKPHTSPNTRKKDAPHLYISWSLHVAHVVGFKEHGTNVIAADVMRHRFARTGREHT
ncbi:MAG TPA: hypothetical protein VLX91_15520 [Candidatus Acidoferrales bacterium]|nr:hypothetical protein [Candidatus Acidoferrales bacterium]